MASEYTPNYNLDLYVDNDKPNLRDQYNGAITKIDTQLHEFSNNLVVVTEAANQARDKAGTAQSAADANAKSISTLSTTVTEVDSAYKAADTKLSSDLTDAYKAADDAVTSAYKAADDAVTSAYKTADTNLNNTLTKLINDNAAEVNAHFPIKSGDIQAGAITRDKLDAQALASLMRGMTIRHFNNRDNTADNEGLSIPSGGSIEGYYIPELTLLVVTYLEVSGTFDNIILPSYVPRPMVTLDSGKVRFGIGIIWDNTSGFKNWYYIYYTREGFLYGAKVASGEKVSLAGSAICYLRAYGAE